MMLKQKLKRNLNLQNLKNINNYRDKIETEEELKD